MDKREVDARGLACPRPVVMTKKALDEMGAGVLAVLVSQEVQSRNVSQVAEAAGYRADVEKMGDYFRVTIYKPQASPQPEPGPSAAVERPHPLSPVTFLLTSDALGSGDEQLGRLLAQLMIQTLSEAEAIPARLIFMNSAVRLVCKGSAVLEPLAALQERGVELLACGTCLQHFGLLDEVQVGTISNMYDIVEALMSADRTVCL